MKNNEKISINIYEPICERLKEEITIDRLINLLETVKKNYGLKGSTPVVIEDTKYKRYEIDDGILVRGDFISIQTLKRIKGGR